VSHKSWHLVCLGVLLLALQSTAPGATVLLQYDAAGGGTPEDVGWQRFGTPMTNPGNKLVQDNTAVAGEQSGEYRSPSLPAGAFTRGGADYGIEFRVQPLTDVQFVGSDWPQAYLSWSDDQFNYNITVDKFSAGNSSGTGDIVYGKGSFSPAITAIDWTVPHTVFIGYRGGSVFDFYLDGALKSTITEGSIARTFDAFYANRIDFGDGTTANTDVAADWYSVSVYDVNNPALVPEPSSLALAGLAGLGLMRRRRPCAGH